MDANSFPGPLFTKGPAKSAAFCNLRDSPNPEAKKWKEFVEELWQEFNPCADENFLQEIRNDFHARFWEMYLTCALRQRSPGAYTVFCPKPGPDVLLEHDSQRIWVEAVTATSGDPQSSDCLIEPDPGFPYRIPEDKIILRYAHSIVEKQRKYLEYREKRVIAEFDSCVVAINGSALPYGWSGAYSEMPRILKAVFPLGSLEMVFNRSTKQVVERRHQFRPSVRKANLAEVPTDVFLRDDFNCISAILFSMANAGMTGRPLGADFVLVHNPRAERPIPRGLIAAAKEYYAVPVHDGYELMW